MRRRDKQITDRAEIESIIQKAAICRIALCVNNVPYIVPLNYGYKDNALYLHSAREGKKIDMLAKNSRVCFEIDTDHELVLCEDGCECSFKYKSVIGFGEAHIVNDPVEKKNALDVIMEHYTGKTSFNYGEKAINAVAVIKLEIESMTGKKSGY